MFSDSDAFLAFVWQASLWLAGAATAIALGLTARRWFEERAHARKAVRQREISRLVQALLASPRAPEPGSVPPLRPGDEPALLSVTLDILRVTRGRDAERMRTLTEIWNLRPHLKKLLAGRSRNRTIRALTLLSSYTDAESLDLLIGRIEDPSVYVQLAALRGVAERGDVGHLPLVLKALTVSRETNVPMLSDILRRFGESAVPFLSELAVKAVAPGVRYAAVSALGDIGSLQAFPLLSDLACEAPLAGVRSRALRSLAQLGDPRAEPALRRGLRDEDDKVRTAAALAVGRLRLRALLPALVEALNDEAWEVRYRAAESLYNLGAPGIAALRAVVSDDAAEGVEARPLPGAAARMAAELLAEKTGASA